MKNDKIIPGIILVLIGAGILLANFGYLHFMFFDNIFRLWPIFLVIAGVNLVLASHKELWAKGVKLGVLIVGLGLLLFGDFGERFSFWPHRNWHSWHRNYSNNSNDNDDNDNSGDNDDNGDSTPGKNVFNQPFAAGIRMARLNISGGATSYYLSDTTNQLFNANTNDNRDRYVFSSSVSDSVSVVDFKMKNHNGFNFNSDDDNRVNMKLNPNPVWMVNIDAGAAKVDFDFSKFKIKSLDVRGGAAAFDIRLGQPLAATNVEVNTGVSAVDIKIPENAACSIESNSGLSGNDFEGFTKTHDNVYETANFATAKNKLYIHINGGLSGFNVSRY